MTQRIINECVDQWLEALSAMENMGMKKAADLLYRMDVNLQLLERWGVESPRDTVAAAMVDKLAKAGKWIVQSYPVREGGELELYDNERDAVEYLRECREYAEFGQYFEIIQPDGFPAKDEYDPYYEPNRIEQKPKWIATSFNDHDWKMSSKL